MCSEARKQKLRAAQVGNHKGLGVGADGWRLQCELPGEEAVSALGHGGHGQPTWALSAEKVRGSLRARVGAEAQLQDAARKGDEGISRCDEPA